MSRLLKLFLVAALTLAGFAIAGSALAGAGGDSGLNDAEDDISSETNQSGGSASGDAVAGQVVGAVSAGDTSIDATNRSEGVDVESGEASATNFSNSFVGQSNFGTGENELDGGEIDSEVSQAAEASSGDGVGGQVIGVVTSAGGSADIVGANTSEDVDVETGDAFADNTLFPFIGQRNDQAGDNEAAGDISGEISQDASAATGDGVGGQVLGIVSAGDTSIDATNESTDVDIETGDGFAENTSNDGSVDPLVGQSAFGDSSNELEGGDIDGVVTQVAESTSGDGVGGQVIGAVTSAGGSADIVAANTSEDVDVETGDASTNNRADLEAGQYADFDSNDAEDDISGEISQDASAATGDGVGGQVLGIVSAGDTSIDATNESTDVDVETGAAFAGNLAFLAAEQLNFGGANFSDGEIDATTAQTANATSGDAVAGQVAGVVTSAGGSANLVLANTSEDVDAESGLSDFFNESAEFVGQQTFGVTG